MSSGNVRDLMAWYLEAGVDETIDDSPVDHYAAPPSRAPPPPPLGEAAPVPVAPPPAPVLVRPVPPPPASVEAAVGDAHALAARAQTVDELRTGLERFEGCALRRTATRLCFIDGNPSARILLVGEGPGEEEDRQGRPFVGPSGRLLDRMLGSIGLDRTRVLISNTVFWRPPGNRTPTTQEMAVCMPFVERLIEIVMPEILVALGGAAAKTLLGRAESVGRLRGQWFPYATPRMARPAEATVLYHPSFLLRSPGQKRAAWQDLLALHRKLASGC
jgi:DNA polymerase